MSPKNNIIYGANNSVLFLQGKNYAASGGGLVT